MNDLHVGRPLWFVTQKVVLTNAASRRNNLKNEYFSRIFFPENFRRIAKLRRMTKKNQEKEKKSVEWQKIRRFARGKKSGEFSKINRRGIPPPPHGGGGKDKVEQLLLTVALTFYAPFRG